MVRSVRIRCVGVGCGYNRRRVHFDRGTYEGVDQSRMGSLRFASLEVQRPNERWVWVCLEQRGPNATMNAPASVYRQSTRERVSVDVGVVGGEVRKRT
jgi:hypothetical protein